MMQRILLRATPQTLRVVALLIVLGLVIAFFSTQIDNYLNGRLFNRTSSSVAIMALIATGQTIVILTRNIDLSVGSIVGFTAFATGSLITTFPDLNPALLVLFSMAVGAGFGVINGLLVAFARVPSIIMTLATLALFRSALVEFSDAKSITSTNLPQWLVQFPNTRLFELGQFQFRAGFVSAIVVVILIHFLLVASGRRAASTLSDPTRKPRKWPGSTPAAPSLRPLSSRGRSRDSPGSCFLRDSATSRSLPVSGSN